MNSKILKEVLEGALRGSLLGLSIVWVAFFIIPGCRTIVSSPSVDPKIKPYVQTFLERCSQYKTDCSKLNSVIIELGTIPNLNYFLDLMNLPPAHDTETIGICFRNENRILINEAYFKRETRERIEALVVHELGHCILDKDHTSEDMTAIMNPFSLYGYVYIRHYQQLFDDFFECKKDCPVVEFSYARY